jgi:hypothetical protein
MLMAVALRVFLQESPKVLVLVILENQLEELAV